MAKKRKKNAPATRSQLFVAFDELSQLSVEGDIAIIETQAELMTALTEIARAIRRPDPDWLVHNHAPDQGPGATCPEATVNGRLLGQCMVPTFLPF